MLQYLINTTAIWLMSLILFDVLLRKESYHGYNRFYLLFTFLMGMLIPLWQWQDAGRIYSQTFQQPLDQVIAAKKNMVSATMPAATTVNWEQWLTAIYLSGALIAICLLIVEVIKLVTFYTKGSKSLQGGWAIVETGKEHAPFSFRNTLFVCSRQQYTTDQWNMLLTHEAQHSARLHLADLALMQACRIIFWFHPLVYIYNRRLLLVHEYQADHVAGSQPQAYGAFLVEQALLQAAPSISNSFNRSPIKKRIVMLTRKSSAASRTKMLVFIPLALVCMVCFTKNTFSQKFERHGNIVTYRGNKIEMDPGGKTDTMNVTDPVTGKENLVVTATDPRPLTVNGERIYDVFDVTSKPVFHSNDYTFRNYIMENIAKELEKLPDGAYSLGIGYIVTGIKGDIIYYDFDGIKKSQSPFISNDSAPISEKIKKETDKKIERILSETQAKPGQLHGKNVPVITIDGNLRNPIEIQGHKIINWP